MTESKAAKWFRRQAWQRHLNTVMLGLIVAGIVWTVQTLATVDKSVASVLPRVQAIEVQIAGMYRADIAARDVAALTARIDRNERRHDEVQKQLQSQDKRLDLIELRLGRARAGGQ